MDQVKTDSVSLILSIGMIGMFVLAVSIILFVLVYKRRIVEAQLVHQQHLIETAVAIQEEERKRFAADLHDEIGGGISTILLSLSGLAQDIKGEPDQKDKVHAIQKQLDDLLNSVREISYDITPYTLETYGLIATLTDVCYQIQESGQLQIEYTCTGDEERLSFATELAIYRIFKELISNTIKHAEASLITILVTYGSDYFKLNYTDDGKGYPTDTAARGNGINNMIHRAKILGADFEIKNSSTQGMEASIHLKRYHER